MASSSAFGVSAGTGTSAECAFEFQSAMHPNTCIPGVNIYQPNIEHLGKWGIHSASYDCFRARPPLQCAGCTAGTTHTFSHPASLRSK